jgi:hypothetical protein
MPFIKNKNSAILKTVAAAFSLFLLALSVSLPAHPSPVLTHAESLRLAEPPQGSSCQAVMDAGAKLYSVPYHMYMTNTNPAVMNGKPMTSESISVGGKLYVMLEGKWMASPFSLEEMKQKFDENKKNVQNASCNFVRNESVNGETAALFTSHEETAHGKNDNQMWISMGKGLILKQETDIDIGNGRPKTHLSSHFEYANVQAPTITK